MKNLKFSMAALLTAGLAAPALAAPVTITDTTPGTATNDGTVSGGEYVGSSSGINGGFGGVIGSGATLSVDSSAAGGLNFGLTKGGGGFNDVGVIYIDSIAGGVADLSTITDNSSRGRAAISGDGEFGDSSNLTFATGFLADYAIAVSYQFGEFADLYQINGDGTLSFVTGGNLTPGGSDVTAAQREFNYLLSDIGLTPGDSFDYVMTYLNSGNGFRSDEFQGVAAFGGGNPGNGGSNAILSTGDFNTFNSVIPEPGSLALLGLGGLAMLRRRR